MPASVEIFGETPSVLQAEGLILRDFDVVSFGPTAAAFVRSQVKSASSHRARRTPTRREAGNDG
jgi:hypothetical protein